MGHIKRFNEEFWDQESLRPKKIDESHLDFLNKFIDDLTKMRDKIEESGVVEQSDQNWIEELYQLHRR